MVSQFLPMQAPTGKHEKGDQAMDHLTNRGLLSVAEAATRIGMSDRWLWDRIRSKELQFVQLGRRRLVRPQDLDAFVDERVEKAS